ncbi:GNAT family N-acetyltransferase [Burkholderia thailandensis]|uniref:GNAT family N-acetyltransferase n=1 Tax=Burkholderia thailandensis TaxID=57975 RepID=UPI00217D458A|nr:GNAT family N-acetyltransferase [Burkholderia thailandensis]MCS6473726.1 GNAT family N-acetyltransferase [Burkholderia thailandensis]
MPNVTLVVADRPEPAEIDFIGAGLTAYNVERVGVNDERALAVFAKDPDTGALLGGLTGRTSLGLMFVDLFYLADALRGDGVGREILRLAEDEARQRGCGAAVLYTISFQAPAFYEKFGWRRFGEVPCDPPGTSRVFMTKTLR